MTEPQAHERTKLRGEITRVVFENEDGSFAVIRVRESGGREYAVCGPVAGVVAGQEIEITGSWEQHAEFGRQFRALFPKGFTPPDTLRPRPEELTMEDVFIYYDKKQEGAP